MTTETREGRKPRRQGGRGETIGIPAGRGRTGHRYRSRRPGWLWRIALTVLIFSSCSWDFESKDNPAPPPLPVPTETAATGGNGSAVVTWKAAAGAQTYNLYWSEQPGVSKTAGTKIAGVSSPYVHGGLVAGRTYYYVVTAVHPGGESEASAVVSALITGTDPAPAGVEAAGGEKTVTIRWTPVSATATYNLYWSTWPGVTKENGQKFTGVASPYVHGGLTNGRSYYYVVTAVERGRESDVSAEAMATPLKDPATARMRLVWAQDGGGGTDPAGRGDSLRLMGYDSADGRGERTILTDLRNYAKPLLTPRGDRVVFSDRSRGRVYMVNWDGSGLQEIARGLALAVWQDPSGVAEWVYVGQEDADERSPAVERFRLDDPAVRELVWNRTMVTTDSFQLTRDGRVAGANVPWPDAGVMDVTDGTLWILGRGCWTSLAPEGDRGLFWIFDSDHRNVTIFDLTLGGNWTVSVNGAPGIGGYEVYHPRWSNHPRIMAMTGPYTEGTGTNRIAAGGKQVEIYVGIFNRDYTAIETWRRITANDRGDFFPDVWVAGD